MTNSNLIITDFQLVIGITFIHSIIWWASSLSRLILWLIMVLRLWLLHMIWSLVPMDKKTLFIARQTESSWGTKKGREFRQHMKWAMGLCKIQVCKNSRDKLNPWPAANRHFVQAISRFSGSRHHTGGWTNSSSWRSSYHLLSKQQLSHITYKGIRNYPGKFLFSSLVDKVIEIIETWRVISKLH